MYGIITTTWRWHYYPHQMTISSQTTSLSFVRSSLRVARISLSLSAWTHRLLRRPTARTSLALTQRGGNRNASSRWLPTPATRQPWWLTRARHVATALDATRPIPTICADTGIRNLPLLLPIVPRSVREMMAMMMLLMITVVMALRPRSDSAVPSAMTTLSSATTTRRHQRSRRRRSILRPRLWPPLPRRPRQLQRQLPPLTSPRSRRVPTSECASAEVTQPARPTDRDAVTLTARTRWHSSSSLG